METLIVKKVEELTTSKGAPYKKIDVQKADGGVIAGVSAFSFKYPNLAELVEGATITAMIVIDGSYKNLVSAVEKPRGGAPGAFKQAQVKEVMDIKRQDIQKSQENKEVSIKIASTIRMAVDIATSLTPDQWHGTSMEEEVKYWREWLWLEWEQIGSDRMKPF